MSEDDDFRALVRAELERGAPACLRGKRGDPRAHVWGGKRDKLEYPGSRAWLELAVRHGWTAPAWPIEYGGGGLSAARARIVEQEIARLDLPPPLVGFGLSMVGPVLLVYGSDAVKREHLPRIARGEVRWCQGYSEPNAGSDLAALQTAAILDGDELVVNGQKIWTSYGDLSDWMFMLVRTDAAAARRQAGITFLLVDLASPGIEVRPIRLISGSSPFCETFFTDVRVPARNVVGEVNGGWTVAKALLGHERAMLASHFGARGADESGAGWSDTRSSRLVALARRQGGEAEGKIADAVVRDRIAQIAIDEVTFAFTVQRLAEDARGAAGRRAGAEASLLKVYGTELNQRREELAMSIVGQQGLGWEGEGFAAEELAQTRDWLRSRGNTIEGGTSEIQLNVIAKQALGLPD
ncbi:MAG TPA: acyl-CoA dehydrogenase family protein [Polyangiaceae bacterium]|nr:acyl-CoA dehydrogenase family protein [Polyangiaceae bacterium]